MNDSFYSNDFDCQFGPDNMPFDRGNPGKIKQEFPLDIDLENFLNIGDGNDLLKWTEDFNTHDFADDLMLDSPFDELQASTATCLSDDYPSDSLSPIPEDIEDIPKTYVDKIVEAIDQLANDSECESSVAIVELPVGPYSPITDHCYFIRTDTESVCYSPPTVDSSDSDSSGSDIDVETVPESPAYSRLANKRRRSSTQRENVPPIKIKCIIKEEPESPPKRQRRQVLRKPSVKAAPARRGRRPTKQQYSSMVAAAASDESASSQCSSDAETDIRSKHNKMERERRNVQRAALDKLRRSIPDLDQNGVKTPKVMVLKKAVLYMGDLHKNRYELNEKLKRLQDKNAMMKKKLQMLRMTNYLQQRQLQKLQQRM